MPLEERIQRILLLLLSFNNVPFTYPHDQIRVVLRAACKSNLEKRQAGDSASTLGKVS
jgi:hypothetical protein